MRAHAVRVAVAAAGIAAMALLVAALRPIAPDVSLGALFTIVVLGAAVGWGLGYAVAVSVASLLVFDFFFLPPAHRLSLSHATDWTALVVYLVTGVVASHLAASARRRAADAERRERHAALLADLAARLLERGDLDELVARLESTDDAGDARLRAAVDALLAIAAQRERLEREALEAEALRRSDAIKTAVIQSVSHDLRTPLATIVAAVDGLEGPPAAVDPAARRELVATVRHEVARLERLVANLLDLSRLQAGAAVPAPGVWTVDALVADALGELEESDRVRVELPDDAPPVYVDGAQVQRVLVNLLENALKFSPPATPVTVRAARSVDEALLRIEDSGPGVAEDAATAIFEPFHHAPRSGGAGLGLAIARGFAAANGARLWVERAPSGGAAFVLALPVADVAAPVPA